MNKFEDIYYEVCKVLMSSSEPTDSILDILVRRRIVYGHSKSLRSADFCNLVLGNSYGLDIIDPKKIVYSIKNFYNYLHNMKARGYKSDILILFNKGIKCRSFLPTLVNICKKYNQVTLISERWLGGTITNLKHVKVLNRAPTLVFSFSAYLDTIPLSESFSSNVFSCAITDSNSLLKTVSLPLIGNDDNINSISFFASLLDISLSSSKDQYIQS